MPSETIQRKLAVLAALSLLLTLVALMFSTSEYGFAMFISYFLNPVVLLMNWLPVALLMGLFYFATTRGWLAFLLTCIPVLALGIVNYYKLMLRNDPLLFADIKLFTEAATMAGGEHYSLSLTPKVFLGVACVVLAVFWGRRQHVFRLVCKPTVRLAGLLGCTAILAAYAFLLCPGDFAYAATRNYHVVSEWSPTGNYVCRGLIYPFLRSIKDSNPTPPKVYNEVAAKAALAAYGDDDIPEGKKVDIIGIMLEAYGDFSNMESLTFQNDPYADWKSLAAESYSGELLVNVFAGETINTERSFLTGYLDPVESYRAPVNSYVWYLRNQGYTCFGNHPCYNWFYNRLNINKYLGFEDYHFYEDRYNAYAKPGLIADDADFLPTIIEDYNAAKAQGKPIFSFNVTYQNHGPYFSDVRYTKPYLAWKMGYNTEDYNIANNYLAGIEETGKQLRAFVENFRTEERPVIIVLFGDHMPWWGDSNSTYKMFNVNLDLATQEGFYNYYTTPYLIWANDAAKATLGNRFTADGGRTSPAYLMQQIFELAGWQGPAYMKAVQALEAETPFINRVYRMEADKLVGMDADTRNAPDWLKDFWQLEYYQKHSAVAQP